ncbi:histidine kinase, partial [Kineosporia mesophila]|uniref:sensor histidine kinase n=1 Tax=Kineosporia mesophila TaxID=566012 RepID=UPI001E2BE09E|nr:histidine kinase [Kineosporia mesophila]
MVLSVLGWAVAALVGLGALVSRRREMRWRQRDIAQAQLAVAAERRRIARELHDVVSHHIGAVVMRAQAADRMVDARPDQLRETLREIGLDGQRTLTAMRETVKVLRSADAPAAATLAQIPETAARMRALGMPVELRLPAAPLVLEPAVELAAVRIVQESLTNALVHARAGRAMVVLRDAGDGLLVEVHDSGPAGDGESTGSGYGLIGMRERAAACGGTLEVGRSHLGGWRGRAH